MAAYHNSSLLSVSFYSPSSRLKATGVFQFSICPLTGKMTTLENLSALHVAGFVQYVLSWMGLLTNTDVISEFVLDRPFVRVKGSESTGNESYCRDTKEENNMQRKCRCVNREKGCTSIYCNSCKNLSRYCGITSLTILIN